MATTINYGWLEAVNFVVTNVVASQIVLQLLYNDHWIELVFQLCALVCSMSATMLVSRGCTSNMHAAIEQWGGFQWLWWLIAAFCGGGLSTWTLARFAVFSVYLRLVMYDTRHWTWPEKPRTIDSSSLAALLTCTPIAYSTFTRLCIKYQSRVLDSIHGVPVLYLCALCTVLGVVNSKSFHVERHAKTIYSALWVADIGFLFFLTGEPMPELRYLIGIVGINLFLFETLRQ